MEKLTCELCGKDFYVKRYRMKKARFCSISCSSKKIYTQNVAFAEAKHKSGNAHPNFKGGHKRKDGYKLVSINGRLRYEHRVLMEGFLGRELSKEETLHHKNGVKDDNRIENLEVLTRSEHTNRYHKKSNNYVSYETLLSKG